jgi:AcrR family transcriptional regulator
MSPPDRSGAELIWFRPARARRGPQPTWDRDEITRVAVGLADAEGLDAVSMRRIAAELGSGVTSLYWHVSSKDDLHELMADAVIGEIALPDRSGDWKADLRAIALTTHATLRAHPWLILLGIQPGMGPKTRSYGNATLPVFDPLGLDLPTRVNALAAVNNYVFGFVHRAVAWHQLQHRTGLTDEQWDQRLGAYADDAAARDPELAERMLERFTLAGEDSFVFGLDCLLDGIETHLTR